MFFNRRRRRRNANPTQFDAPTFQGEVTALAHESPEKAAEVATHWKSKFMNAMMDARNTTEKGLELAAAGVSAGLIGYLDGQWDADADAIIAEWQLSGAAAAGKAPDSDPFVEGGKEDPRKIFGLDIAFWYTAGLAAIAIFNLAGQYSTLVAAGAIGSASYYVGKMAQDAGYKARVEAASKTAEGAAA
jgi:hypothetical protein